MNELVKSHRLGLDYSKIKKEETLINEYKRIFNSLIVSWDYHEIESMSDYEYYLVKEKFLRNHNEFTDLVLRHVTHENLEFIPVYILETIRDKSLKWLSHFEDIINMYFENNLLWQNFIRAGYRNLNK